MLNYADSITQAKFAVQDKIGKVLSSGSQLLAIKARAANFLNTTNPSVNEQAAAITAKANGLVSNLEQIQADALRLGGQSNAILAEIQSDPTWQAIQTNPSFMSYAGYAVKAAAENKIGQASAIAQQLAGVAARADEHLKQVSRLAADQVDVENFAQGKGISAKLSSVGGFFGGVLEKETTILSAGAVLIGGFMLWQFAAPERAAGAALHRNPRRRRRS